MPMVPVAKRQSRRHARQKKAPLFNQLVGAQRQRFRDGTRSGVSGRRAASALISIQWQLRLLLYSGS
jgi:hypothetical protein